MKRLLSGVLAHSVLLASLLSTPVVAQELKPDHFKVVGIASTIPVAIYDEKPFWTTTLPADSKGKLTADLTPIEQMGLDDQSLLRLMKLGVMDFAGMDITKMAGDDPRFEACDLAGALPDMKKARAACSAYRDVLDRRMEASWNTKLLAIGASTPQVLWCRDEVKSIEDLKGKKIRVFNNTLRDFVTGLGATSVSIAFSEVVPALSNGVVDCAVTGSLSGNTAGWPEVTKSVFMLPLGWSFNVVTVNKKRWDALPPETKAFLTKEFAAYEDKMWETLAQSIDQAAICSTGKPGCKLGKPTKVTLVEPSEADMKRASEIVAKTVLPGWAKRCGAACVAEWNDRIGTIAGVKMSAN
ncbi:TRAP transporter substrate-binding protein [Xanthobacter dioxanivorans]|uniref:TRAP transporter substrate-binding protein n=1 Tax=Xanthobacter dioxanivorans TaxID=2528964 RepID=A0A974SKA6_9HYPH|nr:TRAP transporter substrate-binding protein [Xanthobacter dioxanivorans]QRG07328.1 TRAP transporter substrate-binding protein [Xanthobacter dioxanivorans]